MESMRKTSDVDRGTIRNDPANRPARSVPARGWMRRLGLCLLVAAGLVILLGLFHAPLLTGLAAAWVVNDAPANADAIIVLGGGPENRPFAAAELYHEGFAPKILYMDVKLDPAAGLGITLSERELTRRLLLSNNVPETALSAIGDSVASTYDESRAVRAWAENNHAKSIIIATDPFHTRRVHWLFRKQLDSLHVRVMVRAAPTTAYSQTNWWEHEQGLIAFQNEMVKYAFYRLKY